MNKEVTSWNENDKLIRIEWIHVGFYTLTINHLSWLHRLRVIRLSNFVKKIEKKWICNDGYVRQCWYCKKKWVQKHLNGLCVHIQKLWREYVQIKLLSRKTKLKLDQVIERLDITCVSAFPSPHHFLLF